MNVHKRLFNRFSNDVLVPPFTEEIPLDYDPVKKKSGLSVLWRRTRPYLSLLLYRQIPLQRHSIARKPQRILWIYKGTPQLGDSLMDLSGRMLFKDSGIQVDLYTDPHLHQLFQADDLFDRVFSTPEDIRASEYDLVILDSFKGRCIKDKLKYLPRTPFVTIRGYFSGPEFNRTLFSFFRLKQLLQLNECVSRIEAMARPHLASSDLDKATIEKVKIPVGAIAIALGGASQSRTYTHWDIVIKELFRLHAHMPIVLLGSSNAITMREKILNDFRRDPARVVIDCVDQYTPTQTFEITTQCRLMVCVDGGLLHIANAANIPTVSLFDKYVAPELRLTVANRSISLQSEGDISDLPPKKVVEAIKEALSVHV